MSRLFEWISVRSSSLHRRPHLPNTALVSLLRHVVPPFPRCGRFSSSSARGGGVVHEDDAQFSNWVERARRLPSLEALRASFSETNARFERKLRFDFAKVKVRRHAPAVSTRPLGPIHYAPASAASLHQGGSPAAAAPDQRLSSASGLSAPRPIVGKRETPEMTNVGSGSALNHGYQKRPRRLGSPAGVAPQTPTSFPREDTRATSPDTGSGHYGDAALEYVPHESGDSLARRAMPAAVGQTPDEKPIRLAEFERLQSSVTELRRDAERQREMLDRAAQDFEYHDRTIRELPERLEWVETPASGVQRLQRLEQGLARLEGQIDMLLRLQQGPVAPPHWAPAPGNPPGPGPDTA